jgi:hypothetical protein
MRAALILSQLPDANNAAHGAPRAACTATQPFQKESQMARRETLAEQKVEKTMHERKHGTLRSGSGKKITSRKQAIAIGLAEARKAGARIPQQK